MRRRVSLMSWHHPPGRARLNPSRANARAQRPKGEHRKPEVCCRLKLATAGPRWRPGELRELRFDESLPTKIACATEVRKAVRRARD